MNYVDLKKNLASSSGKNIYFLCGNDDFLRENAVRLIRERFLTQPDLNFGKFSGDALNDDVFDRIAISLYSPPFLSEKRIIQIDEYYPTAAELKKNKISDFFASPVDTTIIIINNRGECKALDKFSSIERVVCTADISLCRSWIAHEVKKNGLTIGNSVAELLSEYCLLDMKAIDNELNKLIYYCADKQTITADDVEAVVHKSSDYRIYQMVEFAATRNRDKAYSVFCELLEKNESEQKILVSVYLHFRKLLFVSLSGDDNAELAAQLGVRDFVVAKMKSQAKRLGAVRLKAITSKICEADTALKTGETNLSDALFTSLFQAMLA